jgi:hypothetical protein
MCQQVFARKYLGYQRIAPSPGDFGLEGYTKPAGWAFQCYCPEKHYTQPELYAHLRRKLSRDVAKLRDNASDLPTVLGETVITRWIFVTPETGSHSLLAHAQTKEAELRSWALPFVHPKVTVEIQGGEFYAQEIHQIRTEAGDRPAIDTAVATLPALTEDESVYAKHLLRKSGLRVVHRPKREQERHALGLYAATLRSFVECDDHFRRIEERIPTVHQQLVRIVNEFERHVDEQRFTFSGTPNEMTDYISRDLEQRLRRDLAVALDGAEIQALTRQVVARWLAICALDYD